MNKYLMNILTHKIRLKIAPLIEIDKSAAKKAPYEHAYEQN